MRKYVIIMPTPKMLRYTRYYIHAGHTKGFK